MIHIIFAGLWLGALLVLLLLIRTNVRNRKDGQISKVAALRPNYFSIIVLLLLSFIIFSGVIEGNQTLDGRYAALVATPYGLFLSMKMLLLVVLLFLTYRMYFQWLPALDQADSNNLVNTKVSLEKWIWVKLILGLIIVFLSGLMINEVPVEQAEIESWPYPFRFSIAATWNQPYVAIRVWAGIAILITTFVLIKLGINRGWRMRRLFGISSVLVISGFAIALPPLAIKAYPETYQRIPLSFNATSVANGSALYANHCVECHGYQGMGNGIKSRTLSTKLPDLLIEPHIVEHTPGDFYSWITHGMSNTDMPGFKDKLSDEERWDLVNFIYALSRGYQARILMPEITFERVFAKSPTFSYKGFDGVKGELHEFRKSKIVLMVIFSWLESQDRLEQLKLIDNQLKKQNVTLLAVPIKALPEDELAQIVTSLPFTIINEGATEIVSSYNLWRRTLSHPDIIGRGTNPNHMEFIFDQNGYLRARWIPELDKLGWSDIEMLEEQISLLNREKMIQSLPEEFVQ